MVENRYSVVAFFYVADFLQLVGILVEDVLATLVYLKSVRVLVEKVLATLLFRQ